MKTDLPSSTPYLDTPYLELSEYFERLLVEVYGKQTQLREEPVARPIQSKEGSYSYIRAPYTA
jgi:hypothetical protein